MGEIRKQSIYSSIVIYVGFIIGFINVYLYTKNGSFTTQQYGLTRVFNDLGITFFSFASLGVTSYIYKFQPFYTQNLNKKENDQAAWSLIVGIVGLLLVIIGASALKPIFIRKFSEKSPLLVDYYNWVLPFTAGILFFSIFEAFAWFARKSILTNFLRETGLRLIQTIMILSFIMGWIDFDSFVKIFAFTYPIIAVILISYLVYHNDLHFNFTISRVTKKFKKKILWLMGLIFSSLVINTLAQNIDVFIIASQSKNGLADAGVYTLANFIIQTIQVPQRSIVATIIPVLSLAWKNKNYGEIQRLYTRTSINLLLMALTIFFIIWLNVDDIFAVLNINQAYEAGKYVILILGISKIIDAGTGVNSQIIGTSNFWRFEVFTGMLLLAISIPLNYYLVNRMGIDGSAYSNLIAFGVYNAVRLFFIWYKFKMQPFTIKTLLALLAAFVIYFICTYIFGGITGWTGIIIKTVAFASMFIAAIFALKLSPDAKQLLDLTIDKLGENRHYNSCNSHKNFCNPSRFLSVKL